MRASVYGILGLTPVAQHVSLGLCRGRQQLPRYRLRHMPLISADRRAPGRADTTRGRRPPPSRGAASRPPRTHDQEEKDDEQKDAKKPKTEIPVLPARRSPVDPLRQGIASRLPRAVRGRRDRLRGADGRPAGDVRRRPRQEAHRRLRRDQERHRIPDRGGARPTTTRGATSTRDFKKYDVVRVRGGKFKIPFSLDENTGAVEARFHVPIARRDAPRAGARQRRHGRTAAV